MPVGAKTRRSAAACRGEVLQAAADRVGSGEAFHRAGGALPALRGVVGEQVGDRRAGGVHFELGAAQFLLAPGEERREAGLGRDQAQGGGAAGAVGAGVVVGAGVGLGVCRRAQQCEVREPVQGGQDVRSGRAQRLGEGVHAPGGVFQHEPVDGLRPGVQSQYAQHQCSPEVSCEVVVLRKAAGVTSVPWHGCDGAAPWGPAARLRHSRCVHLVSFTLTKPRGAPDVPADALLRALWEACGSDDGVEHLRVHPARSGARGWPS
ncbi:hypothetical protein GCM10020254_85660 [Streptomyces goshikiensis]